VYRLKTSVPVLTENVSGDLVDKDFSEQTQFIIVQPIDVSFVQYISILCALGITVEAWSRGGFLAQKINRSNALESATKLSYEALNPPIPQTAVVRSYFLKLPFKSFSVQFIHFSVFHSKPQFAFIIFKNG